MPYKKGDRVQHIQAGTFGTVYQDQTDPLLVHISWDYTPNEVVCYKAGAVRIAPWHELNIKDYTPDADWKPIGFLLELNLVDPAPVKTFAEARKLISEQYGGAVKADPASVTPIHKIGDRVKLKYNRSCGTVKANSFPGDSIVPVEWDKAPGVRAIEKLADLVVLYAPRDTDPVNPNQEAIDAIEVQRQVLIKEVNAVQARLRTLTNAKKLLERG